MDFLDEVLTRNWKQVPTLLHRNPGSENCSREPSSVRAELSWISASWAQTLNSTALSHTSLKDSISQVRRDIREGGIWVIAESMPTEKVQWFSKSGERGRDWGFKFKNEENWRIGRWSNYKPSKPTHPPMGRTNVTFSGGSLPFSSRLLPLISNLSSHCWVPVIALKGITDSFHSNRDARMQGWPLDYFF